MFKPIIVQNRQDMVAQRDETLSHVSEYQQESYVKVKLNEDCYVVEQVKGFFVR